MKPGFVAQPLNHIIGGKSLPPGKYPVNKKKPADAQASPAG
jgi:hypothetical protein